MQEALIEPEALSGPEALNEPEALSGPEALSELEASLVLGEVLTGEMVWLVLVEEASGQVVCKILGVPKVQGWFWGPLGLLVLVEGHCVQGLREVGCIL